MSINRNTPKMIMTAITVPLDNVFRLRVFMLVRWEERRASVQRHLKR